jgi:Fe2+ or Zn2+ uptake regulation protein
MPTKHLNADGSNGAGGVDPADEILAYLTAHPQAADSLEGIVSWWLPRQRFEQARARIQETLDQLVERGLVERISVADGTVLYGKPRGDTK